MKNKNITIGGKRKGGLHGLSADARFQQAILAGQMFANETGQMGFDPGAGGGLQPGDMYIANESRFVEDHFSEPLTTYAVGWKDPADIQRTLEFFAPAVTTPERFEYSLFVNAEEFLSETDDVRAIGADFKRIEYQGSKVNARTYNKGLTMRVDEDQFKDQPAGWENIYVGKIMRRLYRNELRRAITLLSAAATNTAKTWDSTAGKDPDEDLAGLLITAQDTSGIFPTRVGYGATAWQKRSRCFRANNSAGNFAGSPLTVQEVAEYLQLMEGYVSKERYQSSASAKSQIVSNLVFLFMAMAGQTREDASNIKRFVSPCVGGTPMRVYMQQVSMKLRDITVEHYSNIAITSNLGIQQVTVS